MKYRLTILKCFTIFVFFVSLALLYACQGNDETSDPIEKLIGMNQSENFHTNRLVDKETPYTLVFENNDSTKSLYIFTSPIGYYDLSERLQLIDTTLVSVTDLEMKKKGYSLETKSCDIVSYFPKRISKAPLLIQGKDSFLSFVPFDELAVENLSKSTFTDLTGRRNSSAVYQKDGNIRLEYVSTTSGIMVNVNIEEKPENYQLDFYIDKQEEINYFINDNKYVVFKTTGNESVTKAIIHTSFLQDSLGAYSFENTVMITPTEYQWKYSIILDESFLNDPDTQYPIIISPTFELYRNKIPDSSVYSNKPSTNVYLANYTVMGNNNFFGDSQHYLRFGINYIFKSYAQNVKSAVYVSTAISRDLEPMSIEMLRMKDIWISSGVNWDTKYPTYSKESTTQISTPGRYEFDITEFVKSSIQDDEWNTEVYGLAMSVVEGSKSIDHEIIKNALINEKGMDPAIYEDENRFYEEIVPEIAKKIEDRVGYEEAHRVVLPDGTVTTDTERDRLDLLNQEPLNSEPEVSAASEELFMEYPEGMDLTISLIDRAVFAKAEEYIMAKREITKREYSAVNDAFIQTNIGNKQREIIYNSRYTSTLVVEATKAEIESYAKKDIVEEVSLFVEMILEPDLNIALGQIGADSSTGTKSSSFNAGAGYRGTNVKIGILESDGGRFDSSAPQLSAISGSRLIFKNNAGFAGAPVVAKVNDHATMVTSLIVGQSVTVSSRTYEGVVPLATVYQTPIWTHQNVFNGIQKLADEGCLVINLSAGWDTGNVYHSLDKEVDNLIKNAAIVFVKSAGNTGGGTNNITSPGKALNAITVGNAQTKSGATTASSSPYGMHPDSSLLTPYYLPNKPDISAPGSSISYIRSSNTVSTASGTSFAAPMVTGIVAQMIQARPSGALITNIKTQLLAGAQASKISTTNNPSAGNYLRQKSGTGLVDAKKAVNIIRNINSVTNRRTLNSTGQVSSFYMGYFNTGQKVRVVMTFYSLGPAGNITQTSHRDDINISMINGATGNSVANSSSAVNNVEIIEYTFVTTGWYDIRLSAYRVLAFSPGVVAVVTWTLI